MNEQEIYRLLKAKEQAISENLLLAEELRSLKEVIVRFLDDRLGDESLLSMRYRKLKTELRTQTLWAKESGYPVDGPAFIGPWINILEQYLGSKAVKKRLEDEHLWVESRVQGQDEHIFIGRRDGAPEKVHIVVDSETGEIRIDPKDQAPHDLLRHVEVILTTKEGKRVRSTRGALEFLQEPTNEETRPTAGKSEKPLTSQAPLPLADLRGRYGRFLARLMAEWESERDSEPRGIDEGKAIMARTRQSVLDFRTELLAFPGTQNVVYLLDQASAELATIRRHDLLFMDAGRSFRAFWAKGDEIIAMLEQARRVLGPSYVLPDPP